MFNPGSLIAREPYRLTIPSSLKGTNLYPTVKRTYLGPISVADDDVGVSREIVWIITPRVPETGYIEDEAPVIVIASLKSRDADTLNYVVGSKAMGWFVSRGSPVMWHILEDITQ